MNNNQSGVNTILLVVIIVALVGGLVWLYDRRAPAANDNEGGANINVTLPGGDNGEGEGQEQ